METLEKKVEPLVENSPAYRSLRLTIADDVAEVVLIGPGKGNAAGPDFWREIPLVFRALDRDPAVRAVIVRGEGKNFCYGLDLPAMMAEPEMRVSGENLAAERTDLYDMILRMQDALNAVAECRKPVVAAIQGWCIGAGLDLIAACDIRLCADDARFSLREVKVAIVADMGSLQRLPTIIGEGYTRDLALTGKDVDAAYAHRIGLVTATYPDAATLLTAAWETATLITQNPPLVVHGVKRVLNERMTRSVEDGLRFVAAWNAAFMQSHDLTEAMVAFMERRPPHFDGR